MKKLSILSICLALAVSTFAQDKKAEEILNKLSDKTETYTSIEADFDYKMENKQANIEDVQSGKLITKNNKYFLNISGQQIFSDGKTMWTLLEDAGEVQVNAVPDENEMPDDYISPTNILSIWEKGFKYKYDGEETLNGAKVDVVNLYPEKPDEKSFHTIKLYVNKQKNQLEKIAIKGKDGTDFTYIIKKFNTNQPIADSKFTFQKEKYPNVDVIDLR